MHMSAHQHALHALLPPATPAPAPTVSTTPAPPTITELALANLLPAVHAALDSLQGEGRRDPRLGHANCELNYKMAKRIKHIKTAREKGFVLHSLIRNRFVQALQFI